MTRSTAAQKNTSESWASFRWLWRHKWELSALVFAGAAGVGIWLAVDEDELSAAVAGVVFALAFVLAAGIGNKLGGDTPDGGATNAAMQEAIDKLTPDKRFDLVMQEWRDVTGVQMHFNEMIIRMRTLAISVVISVFGAGGFAIARYPDQFVKFYGESVHVAAVVVAFGLVLWFTIFVIDYWYYYKLLLGAVRRGYEIDKAFSGAKIVGDLRLFGVAKKISAAIGPRGASENIVWFFYGLVYFTGLAYLIAVLIVLDPAPVAAAVML